MDLPVDLSACTEAFAADGRFELACWLDADRLVYLVDEVGTIETTTEADVCAWRQKTSSSAWSPDGRSVWEDVDSERFDSARKVDNNDHLAEACDYFAR